MNIFMQTYIISVESSLYPVLEYIIGKNLTSIAIIDNSETYTQQDVPLPNNVIYGDIYLRLSPFTTYYRMGFERAD